MARIIEFHIPAGFRSKIRWVSQQERGTLVVFPLIDSKELAGLKRILRDHSTVTLLANDACVGALHHY